ncbi:uncharacterized protein LOC122571645 [Bombus pyrosoma]|uniref:uncharacterized protein LOC122571645 n=1 Tax=Bombus pyrosoma TaxID=396416 RepID=UPI001CB8E66F|nr:uncharacterized protein LOC122571645 [Bombus pyrosoma]
MPEVTLSRGNENVPSRETNPASGRASPHHSQYQSRAPYTFRSVSSLRERLANLPNLSWNTSETVLGPRDICHSRDHPKYTYTTPKSFSFMRLEIKCVFKRSSLRFSTFKCIFKT